MNHATGDDTEELLARAADGDAEAVGDLFKRHRDRLKQMIGIRLDPRLNHASIHPTLFKRRWPRRLETAAIP